MSNPAILFAAVSQGTTILAKAGDDKFDRLIDKLLTEIKGDVQTKAYVHEDYSFNYNSTAKGFIYIAVCDEKFPTRTAFAFLKHIEDTFQPAAASRFESTLAQLIKKYSDPQKVDKIESIKAELNSVKEVMKENIDKIMERGQVLESLEESTAALDFDSKQFMDKATNLHNTMWWRNQKIRIAIAVVVVVLIFAVVWASCGATFQKCGSGSEPEPGSTPTPTPTPTPIPTPTPPTPTPTPGPAI